jgi:hypothetical protein
MVASSAPGKSLLQLLDRSIEVCIRYVLTTSP